MDVPRAQNEDDELCKKRDKLDVFASPREKYERFKHVNAINMGVCILILVIGCANAKVLKRCITRS